MLQPLNLEGYSRKVPWCGPSAVSILTGLPLKQITADFAYATDCRYNDIEGVWAEQALLVLHKYGYTHKQIDVVGRFRDTVCGPTLIRFWREQEGIEKVLPCLIEVDGHLLTSHMGFACDNWTKTPVPQIRFPKPNRLVKAAWIITKR